MSFKKNFLIFFPWLDWDLSFCEEDHRGKDHSHNLSKAYAINKTSHYWCWLSETEFSSTFLSVPIEIFFPYQHSTSWKQVTIHGSHLGSGSYAPPQGASMYMHYLEPCLWQICLFFSIYVFFQSFAKSFFITCIYFILYNRVHTLLILLFKLFQFWPLRVLSVGMLFTLSIGISNQLIIVVRNFQPGYSKIFIVSESDWMIFFFQTFLTVIVCFNLLLEPEHSIWNNRNWNRYIFIVMFLCVSGLCVFFMCAGLCVVFTIALGSRSFKFLQNPCLFVWVCCCCFNCPHCCLWLENSLNTLHLQPCEL